MHYATCIILSTVCSMIQVVLCPCGQQSVLHIRTNKVFFEHTPLMHFPSYKVIDNLCTCVIVHCAAKCVACLHSFTHGMWATFECVPGSHFNAEEAIPLDTARHTNTSVQLDTAKKYCQYITKDMECVLGLHFNAVPHALDAKHTNSSPQGAPSPTILSRQGWHWEVERQFRHRREELSPLHFGCVFILK